MAIIEDVPDAGSSRRLPDVTVEEVPDEPHRGGPPPATPSSLPSDPAELAAALKEVSAQLTLPEDLLPAFLGNTEKVDDFQRAAERTLTTLAAGVASPAWRSIGVDEQCTILSPAMRLYGHNDPWTSSALVSAVSALSENVDPDVAVYALQGPLRAEFSAHPRVSEAAYARAHPAGGAGALDDMHESGAAWKREWGIDNAVAWCATRMPPAIAERNIGLLLPPTLSMLDDWEPGWRARGARVLRCWLLKVDPAELRRRGLDTLLLSSLVHTLSLHNDPPLGPDVLDAALDIARSLETKPRADAYADIVERALVAGWAYAPSAAIAVQVDIAHTCDKMCAVLGTGIGRWLKSIIPGLLSPLQYDPAPQRLPLFRANLATLLTVLRTMHGTGRIPRWRGQILDVCARVWVQVNEHGYADPGDKATADDILALVRDMYAEIERQCPSVRETEFPALLKLSQSFAPLVAA